MPDCDTSGLPTAKEVDWTWELWTVQSHNAVQCFKESWSPLGWECKANIEYCGDHASVMPGKGSVDPHKLEKQYKCEGINRLLLGINFTSQRIQKLRESVYLIMNSVSEWCVLLQEVLSDFNDDKQQPAAPKENLEKALKTPDNSIYFFCLYAQS